MSIGTQRACNLHFWKGIVALPRMSREWRLSNDALAGLLARHWRSLRTAAAMVQRLRLAIDALAQSMTALCRQTCRFCPEPCCITNTVWFDFRDLLLMHLGDAPIPPLQAASGPATACLYLGHRGCRLPWSIRPWMCIKYLCPVQRAVLKKSGLPQSAALFAAIDRIEKARRQVEEEVIRRIRRKTRTSPSSSPACSG